jgi:hypothetical protein
MLAGRFPAARHWPGQRDSDEVTGMRRSGAVLALLALALTACSAPSGRTAAAGPHPAQPATTRPSPDPSTVAALIHIAQTFNDNYDGNNDGPVYDRWDARSQAVISRTEYIRRHAECRTAPQVPAQVESANRGKGGAWLVHYAIAGQQLTDHWYYAGRRWVFDLLLSNPDAARLYRLPFPKYAAQVGCHTH